MTSPPEEITVQCPKCGHHYLDSFDDKYLDQCSSATCPACHHKVVLDVLVVEEV